jgi:hypothetical protein
MNPRFAVFFKTHFWDDFTRRQVARLRARLGNGQLYIVVDESIERAPQIENEAAIRIRAEDFGALGLAEVTTHGSVIWYNIDYPNYIAFSKIPKFDYYVSIEYDATVTVDLDTLVHTLAACNIDYLGFPIRKPATEWPWYDMHLDIYGPKMLVNLSCFSVFSHRAMTQLLARRQEMTRQFALGELDFWPNNEAFIPNEIERAGMSLDTLDHYGSTRQYDWWPPTEESELPANQEGLFIHPVLCGQRYAKSIVHHEPSFFALILPNSPLSTKLRHVSSETRASLRVSEVKRRVLNRVYKSLESAGLRRRWFANALSGATVYAQTKPIHNSED